MTKLEAVNAILRRLGEREVVSIDEPYPTIRLCLSAIESARKGLLLDEWYFNTRQMVNLLPDASGEVRVPEGVLALYPDRPDKHMWTGSYVKSTEDLGPVNEPVSCRIVMDVSFEDMPNAACTYVMLVAASQVYVQDMGYDESVDAMHQEAAQAYQQLSAQHTRIRKFSTRNSVRYRQYISKLRN